MRRISRLLLGLVTSAIPVVIAACYGVAYSFSQRGHVIDRDSKVGVGGLRVECRTASNSMSDMTHSSADGTFYLSAMSSSSCATIAVQDEREAGARYAPTTAKSDPAHDLEIQVVFQP